MTREAASDMAMLPHEYRVMFDVEQEYWWYRGLRVLLLELLHQYLPRNAARNTGPVAILDAGCGTGANLELLSQFGEALGVDIAEEAIAFCRQRGIPSDQLCCASLVELPLADNYIDLAISFDVICNIADDIRAFAELARVLRPGGRAFIQLPAYNFLWSAHDVAVGHKRRYAAQELEVKIKRGGLAVERITYLNTLLFPAEALGRLLRRGAATNGRVTSDLKPLPQTLNRVLARVFEAEMRIALHVRLPYGLSLLAVARKP